MCSLPVSSSAIIPWTMPRTQILLILLLPALARAEQTRELLQLRATGVPSEFRFDPSSESDRLVVDAFRKKYWWIDPIAPSSIVLNTGSRAWEMQPMMQIA